MSRYHPPAPATAEEKLERDRDGAAGSILVDGHAHYYECFGVERFFDAATANLTRAAHRIGLRPALRGCLWLADVPNQPGFEQLPELAARRSAQWTFVETEESISLIARRDGLDEIVLIGGRQIATREGLEVLAVGTQQPIPDGLPTSAVLDALSEGDGLAIFPWGFGKWWLRRGRFLRELLHSSESSSFFLADSALRPEMSRRPKLFELAVGAGIPILAGSDPLPFTAEAMKVGSYGFVVPCQLDPRKPAASLKRSIANFRSEIPIYGRRCSYAAFLRVQVQMFTRRLNPSARMTRSDGDDSRSRSVQSPPRCRPAE
jgi:hypothetical protein